MHIEEYFQLMKSLISAFPAVVSSEISFEQRTSHVGLIKGTLTFPDNSELHFKEFTDVGDKIIKYKYAYHYQKGNKLIFRYDNHPIQLKDIPEHHKHNLSEDNILESTIPDFENVLKEVLTYLSI